MSAYEDLRALLEFRPLDRPLRHYGDGVRSPFKAPWSRTVALLGRELRMLGGERALMLIDFPAQHFRRDGLPRAGRSAYSPAIVLTFRSRKLRADLRYEVSTYDDWRDNVRAIALGLESLRAVDRYGVTRSGEQYQGWKQLEPGRVGDGDPDRGRELVERAGGDVRRALFAAHPDHGGEPDDFRDVIAWRDREAA